jgi:hypothetical protein
VDTSAYFDVKTHAPSARDLDVATHTHTLAHFYVSAHTHRGRYQHTRTAHSCAHTHTHAHAVAHPDANRHSIRNDPAAHLDAGTDGYPSTHRDVHGCTYIHLYTSSRANTYRRATAYSAAYAPAYRYAATVANVVAHSTSYAHSVCGLSDTDARTMCVVHASS